MKRPEIKTQLPGPEAKKILADDELFISPSYTRSYPMVAKKGNGCWVEDVDGNTYLDFNAGIAVCSTGHCHPEVVEAIKKQAEELIHMSGTDFYYPQQVELAKKLAEIAPGDNAKRVFLSNSGAEANEAAIKLARYHTKRQYIIAFYGAFHGRTYGAMSLTASKYVQRKHFAPLVPGVIHVPYPNPYRPPFSKDVSPEKVAEEVVQFIEEVVFNTVAPAEEVAAIIAEPIQGEGGYVVPPDNFFPLLKKLCEKYGILLIIDEVQAGMGRTGKMFAIEHFGIEPDIISVAKGIASGMPLGATIASRDVMDWPPGAHATTFGGNPVSCAAALKTIELLQNELIENAARQGEYLLGELKKFMDEFEFIGDVRGKGLMIGVEIVKDRETKERDGALRDKIVDEAFRKGLLLLGAGANVIRFCPPLVVTKEEIDVALEILRDVMKSV